MKDGINFKLRVSYVPAPDGQPSTITSQLKPWACALAVVAIVAASSVALATAMGVPTF